MKEKRDKQQGPLPFIESKTLWNGLRGRRGGGGSPGQTAQVYGRPSLFLKVAQVHSDEPNHTPEQHRPGSEVLGVLFPQRGERQTRAQAKAGSPRTPPSCHPQRAVPRRPCV